jgi:hypothetical protein
MFLGQIPKVNLQKLALRFFGKRCYSSGGHPLSEIHKELRDVEEMFAKYRLDLINNPEELDKLVQDGNIPKILADNLKEDIKHRQEATSKTLELSE